MRFDTRRCAGQPTGTRNGTAEVLPVSPGDPPEVSERGGELLRLSEAISGWLQPEARSEWSLSAQARSKLVDSPRSWGEVGCHIGTS